MISLSDEKQSKTKICLIGDAEKINELKWNERDWIVWNGMERNEGLMSVFVEISSPGWLDLTSPSYSGLLRKLIYSDVMSCDVTSMMYSLSRQSRCFNL